MPLFAAIPPPPGEGFDVGPLTIHYYGIAIALGALLAVTVARRRYAARGGDPEVADRVALWALLLGFVGARLAYVSTHLGNFVDRPWAVLMVWEGGLAFFGGLTLGALAALWALRRYRADLPAFLDAAAPAIPLAQALGRWGNYFNQELYGTPTDLPWRLQIERGGEVVETVHPAFLYESLWNIALAGFIVWLGRRGTVRRGGLIFVYAAGYGFMRFLLELIRTDTTFRLLGLSRNAYVAILAFAVGVVGLWWYQRRGEGTATGGAEAQADAEADERAEAEADTGGEEARPER